MNPNAVSASHQPIVFTRGPYFRIDGLDFKQKAAFKEQLSIVNPAYEQEKRFTGWVKKDTPRHLKGYVELGEAFFVAPGAARAIWREVASLRPTFKDVSIARELHEFTYTGEVRDYQEDALRATFSTRSGCIIAPCGAGKTDIGCRVVAQSGLDALIIVHTKELLHQWVDRVKARLSIDAGIIGGGKQKRLDAPVLIATVQTLLRNPAILRSLRDRRLLIVDECHHTPCSTFTEVLRQLNPERRYGFTATPTRADGTTELMFWWLGEIIAEVPRDVLEDGGHILRPRLEVHILESVSALFDSEEPGDYLRITKKILEDEPRLMSIVAIIQQAAMAGGHHLVLTNSIKYGEDLERILTRRSVKALFIQGKCGKRIRAEMLAQARAGNIQVLIATTLADEGLDLPILDQVHLVTPTRSASKATQRAGRICRPYPGKGTPIIHDYVDVNVRTLRTEKDPETGETMVDEYGSPLRRISDTGLFINQFRARLKAFKEFADYDRVAVNRVLRWHRGGAR